MPLDTQGGKKKPLKQAKRDDRCATEEDEKYKQQQNKDKKDVEAARKAALAKQKSKK